MPAAFSKVNCCTVLPSESVISYQSRGVAHELFYDQTFRIKSGKTDIEALHQRLAGYQLSMKQNGLPVEDNYIQKLDYEYSESDMLKLVKSMVMVPVSIDGIIFATHFLAASGLRALKKLNVRVPEDVAIVSFGQMNAFDLIEPPVTSIIQPVDELGDRAVEILLENLSGENTGFRRIILNNNLEIRKSCGAQ